MRPASFSSISLMRMKKIVLFTLFMCLGFTSLAQSPIYLFPEFTDGTVALRNRSFVKTKFNYDTFHDKLLYLDGDQTMEMTDYSEVFSVYIGERTFVPQGRSLYEVIELGDNPAKLLIKWHQKKNALGKKGAYDQVLHGSSAQSIDPEYYSISLKERGGQQVFDLVVENSYGILSEGQFKKFSDRRSFLKLFPGKQEQIGAYIDENHLLFNKPDDVIAIARFAAQL